MILTTSATTPRLGFGLYFGLTRNQRSESHAESPFFTDRYQRSHARLAFIGSPRNANGRERGRTGETSIDLSATRLSLGEEIFGGVKATVELQRDANSCNITFRPGTVHDLIDSIEVHGTEVVEAGMTMWNDDSVTYQFDDVKGDDLKLNFAARTNFQRLPTVIEVKGIALP